ncbi:MAG: hypothetical protein AB9888_16310 [Bacteroidales bacterium]
MKRQIGNILTAALVLLAGVQTAAGQGTVPAGINYQAVARDNSGNELVNTDIEVRFTIRTGSSQGPAVYQEVFTDVTTSRYGVFSRMIGTGDPVLGFFTEIDWSTANHYLQVEVKFENLFMDMGTMQFMAVPYALYAAKSLEPGPAGPPGIQGPPGDPASDDQQLTWDRNSRDLRISGGNTVKLDTEIAFRAINTSQLILPSKQSVKLIFDDFVTAPNFNIGNNYNASLGEFKPPTDGIYTFNVSLNLPNSTTVIVKVDDREEILLSSFMAGRYTGSITLKLASSNVVTVWARQDSDYEYFIGRDSYFSGFRVY